MMKIFAAEDDPIIRDGLKIALEQEGRELVTAESLAEAKLKLSETDDLDLCILDVMLPDGTGYDICAEIRRSSDMPIIFLTACDDEARCFQGSSCCITSGTWREISSPTTR